MKKQWKRMLGALREPKWRHGKWNALLMAGFLAACVLLNVGVTALENEYGWRRDLSFNQYATLGETTQAVLEGLGRDVELYLLYQSDSEDVTILQVLNRYRAQSPHIRVLETDIARNPGILTRFTGDLESSLGADSVVVNCPDTGRYQVLNYEGDFISTGYNIDAGTFEMEGLAYEKALTEAIYSVSREAVPKVGILSGHGELTATALQAFTGVLESNGYECETVSLLAGDPLDDVDLLLIADPQKDLNDGEIEAISAFMQAGGSLFSIRDYTDPLLGMNNYLALLRSYGVVPLPGVAVAGTEDAGSYYGEPLYLLPYLCPLDLTLSLRLGGHDVLLMPAACAYETPANNDRSLSVATVLKTGAHAYLRSLTDGNDTIDRQEGDRTGELSLALYAHRMHANGNVSRLFAVGNSAMFTDEYIYQSSYSEEFVLALMKELLPQDSLAVDIPAASAFRPALKAGSQTVGVALLIALPLLVAALALCVLLPRRNR